MSLLSLGMGLGVTEQPLGPVRAWVKAGQSFAGLGGISSFTRADPVTCATQVSAAGAITAVLANVLRDAHYVGGVRTVLLEDTRAQKLVAPIDLSDVAWTLNGTTTRTGGQADPAGGTNGWRLLTTSAGDSMYAVVPLAGNGTKLVLCALKAGTAARDRLALYDLTAGTFRHRVNVDWVAGVPTLSTDSGAGTLFAPVALSGGYYLIAFTVTGTLAANTNRVYIYPGPAVPGDVRAFCLNVNDAAVLRNLITANATQAADALTLTGIVTAAASTLYLRYWDLATQAWADAAAAYVSGAAITPALDRAYSDFAILDGTLSAAACRARLGY